tara:strand:- start:232 stop:387 length:156 start_codon:yes stop_codon:yes gene_type:complete
MEITPSPEIMPPTIKPIIVYLLNTKKNSEMINKKLTPVDDCQINQKVGCFL